MEQRNIKNLVRAILVFVIVLCAYNFLAFLIPFRHNDVFWLGYAFGLAAILFQALVLAIAFRGADTARSKYYGIPILRVGLYYLVGQLVLSFAAMALGFAPRFPTWPLWILFVLFLACAALGLIAADAVRDEIRHQEGAAKRDTGRMRELQSVSAGLAARCENEELGAELKKLAEDLRYSDPVSCEASEETENRIGELLNYLGTAIYNRQTTDAVSACKTARSLLEDRNRICKLNKK